MKPVDVPMAEVDPEAVWPVVDNRNHNVAEAGPYTFGASRDRGRRYSTGIEIGIPHRCSVHAPLPGTIVAIRRWSRDRNGAPLLALFLRTKRYIFSFGGIIPDSSPEPGVWVDSTTELGRSRRGIHVSVFEPIGGETDGDFVSRMSQGGMVWHVDGPVPGGLHNPQHFLEDAATREVQG